MLSTGELKIEKPLTIEGPVPGGITVSGGLSSRVFNVVGPTGDVVFRNLSIVDGRDFDGGGIKNTGKVMVDHSLVANNELLPGKPLGGGIYSAGTASELTLVNSTVSGNIGGNGGGIASAGILTIRNSTIVGNSSVQGGGILGFGTNSIRNSIVAYNIDRSDTPDSPNCYKSSGSWIFFGLNITNDNSCGNDPALLITNWLLLGPLANNGGPTKTYALIAGTPAIDGTTDCTESSDQRYVARPKGAGCDVGAEPDAEDDRTLQDDRSGFHADHRRVQYECVVVERHACSTNGRFRERLGNGHRANDERAGRVSGRVRDVGNQAILGEIGLTCAVEFGKGQTLISLISLVNAVTAKIERTFVFL